MRKPPDHHLKHIQRAIAAAGSQGKLAKLLGISQQGVSYFLKADRVTGEMALAIEKATKGMVTREQLRPDLFRRLKPAEKKRTAHSAAAGEGQPVPPATPSPV